MGTDDGRRDGTACTMCTQTAVAAAAAEKACCLFCGLSAGGLAGHLVDRFGGTAVDTSNLHFNTAFQTCEDNNKWREIATGMASHIIRCRRRVHKWQP